MPKLVSILIPAHNAERWLSATLESALAQTWPNQEIILVNDGSTDGTGQVARSFAARGVRIIDQANAGPSAALNRALTEARGDYYEFLDADDLLAPDKIARQMARLSELPAGWLASGSWGRFHDDPARADFRFGPVDRDLAPIDWVIAVWQNHSMMHPAAWLVPAELVARAGHWNEKLTLINDFEFYNRLVLASPGVAYCAQARTYYRSGIAGSLSGRRTPAAWISAYEAVRLGTELLLRRENSARTRAACASVWRNLAFDSYPEAAPEQRRLANRRVSELGEKLGRPAGGPLFTLGSRLVGWKLARRLQRLTGRF